MVYCCCFLKKKKKNFSSLQYSKNLYLKLDQHKCTSLRRFSIVSITKSMSSLHTYMQRKFHISSYEFTIDPFMSKIRSCNSFSHEKKPPPSLYIYIDERCLRMHIEYKIEDHKDARTQGITLNINIYKNKTQCSVLYKCHHNATVLYYCYPSNNLKPHIIYL
jgi:hypothetical protein